MGEPMALSISSRGRMRLDMMIYNCYGVVFLLSYQYSNANKSLEQELILFCCEMKNPEI